MTGIQIYFLVLILSIITSFVSWVLMQVYFEWEIFWRKITTFAFISLIITIFVGLFYVVRFLSFIF